MSGDGNTGRGKGKAWEATASQSPVEEQPQLRISVHGPGANIESAIEVAEATKKLLAAVGEELGVPAGAVEWQIGSIQFQCDGCGLKRPDRPGPDEGWTYRDGDDLCPTCGAQAKPSTAIKDFESRGGAKS